MCSTCGERASFDERLTACTNMNLSFEAENMTRTESVWKNVFRFVICHFGQGI